MLARPKNLSCPSLSSSSLRKVCRQPPGAMKGNSPSMTNIRASAAQKTDASNAYFLPAGAAGAAPLPRNALKNSEPAGSTTSTSERLLKLDLYASRLR